MFILIHECRYQLSSESKAFKGSLKGVKGKFMERKIAASQLQIGMYVSATDQPMISGFVFEPSLIETEAFANQIRNQCEFIYIDPSKGLPAENYIAEDLADELLNITPPDSERVYKEPTYSSTQSNPDLELKPLSIPKSQLSDIEKPFGQNSQIYQEIKEITKIRNVCSKRCFTILHDISMGKHIDVAAINAIISPLLHAAPKCPDAFSWLSKRKTQESYIYQHPIDACIDAIIFGLHMDISDRKLEILAASALMMDIGKVRCPASLLFKQGELTQEEFERIKKHVEYSTQVIRPIKGLPKEVLSAVENHHERYDGSGYPQGISGTRIPLYSQIIAIVDCYDAMTSRRTYGDTLTPDQTTQIMYRWRNTLFPSELVEKFIEYLGAHPISSIVELSNGEIGIVSSINRKERLYPKVVVLLDKDKRPHAKQPEIDLAAQSGGPKERLGIVRFLAEGDYGIHARDFL